MPIPWHCSLHESYSTSNCVRPESNAGVVGMLLPILVVDLVVHEFEELLLHLGLCAGREIDVIPDVGLEPPCLLELYKAV